MVVSGQNGGSGGTSGAYAPQVLAAAARLKAQASQAPAQAQANSGADVASIRQQMQATRAVGENYTQQMMQAGAGGAPDYGQAQAAQVAAQVAAQMQAFRQRSAVYARMNAMAPQAFTRALMLQAMSEAGQDTDGLQSLWATQDAASAGDGQ